MLETQPLLAQESGSSDQQNTPEPKTWADATAEFLESPILHKVVITLITIDAACVLADLSYTLLTHSCSPEDPESPFWLEVLSHVSLGITSLFLIEIPFSLWAFGFRFYNPLGDMPYAPLHIFDALIIISTFTLEFLLKGRERELVGLLIVLRLWRLVKLVGGVAVGAGELGEEESKQFAETKKELAKTRDTLRAVTEENERLKRQITVLEGRDSYA